MEVVHIDEARVLGIRIEDQFPSSEVIDCFSNGEAMRRPAPKPMRRQHTEFPTVLEIRGDTAEVVRIDEE